MNKIKIRFIDIVYFIAIIVADIIIYIFFGLLLMGYDDNWNSSKGEYWSWSSMTANERLVYTCFNVWNVLNIIGIVFFIIKIYKRFKHGA